MPLLQVSVKVVGNTSSAWISTAGSTNIIVGVIGSSEYRVEYNLGGDAVYAADSSEMTKQGTLIAKAENVRVTNTGVRLLKFEVFA